MTEDSHRTAGASYAAAGVDIAAGDRAVELFAPLAKKASRPEVMGGLGGFAGLFSLKGDYKEPLLAASTDGVGTKLAVAQAMDKETDDNTKELAVGDVARANFLHWAWQIKFVAAKNVAHTASLKSCSATMPLSRK